MARTLPSSSPFPPTPSLSCSLSALGAFWPPSHPIHLHAHPRCPPGQAYQGAPKCQGCSPSLLYLTPCAFIPDLLSPGAWTSLIGVLPGNDWRFSLQWAPMQPAPSGAQGIPAPGSPCRDRPSGQHPLASQVSAAFFKGWREDRCPCPSLKVRAQTAMPPISAQHSPVRWWSEFRYSSWVSESSYWLF